MQGAQVSGNWEEKTYSATGDVSGRYTGSSFVLSIQGANFTAAMNVGLSSCKQSITITPQGARRAPYLHEPREVLTCAGGCAVALLPRLRNPDRRDAH